MATIAIIGTCDTKLDQLIFLRDEIRQFGNTQTLLIDVGRASQSSKDIDISSSDLILKHGQERDVSNLPRGEFIEFISLCATLAVQSLYINGSIDGIISAGGSGGTSLASIVMRDALPIGFPKFIVSTVASGDTGPIVGESDITLMYSVMDIAGLNQVLKDIMANAAAAVAGAATSYARRRVTCSAGVDVPIKKHVAVTMFGVTTPGADAIRQFLESRYPIETYIFHATGHGGKAMERLIRDGQIDAVIDLTTTEITDFVMGGVMSAGSERLDAAIRAGIPNIISLGAVDMANFGPKTTVPEKFRGRTNVAHNPIITLVRSSTEDCKAIGQFLCEKLKEAPCPEMIQVWIPKGGVSMLSVPGGPFYDKDADEALFNTIKKGLENNGIKVIESQLHVNHTDFVLPVAKELVKLMHLDD